MRTVFYRIVLVLIGFAFIVGILFPRQKISRAITKNSRLFQFWLLSGRHHLFLLLRKFSTSFLKPLTIIFWPFFFFLFSFLVKTYKMLLYEMAHKAKPTAFWISSIDSGCFTIYYTVKSDHKSNVLIIDSNSKCISFIRKKLLNA